MELTEQQKKVLNMPFHTFLDRYVPNKGKYVSVLVQAVTTMQSCTTEEAENARMSTLVAFSKKEWYACKGIGGHCLSALDDAYEKTGLDFSMVLPDNWEEEGEEASNQPPDEQVISIFQSLQNQMIKMGGSKTEFKMLRPDGYTWVVTVLPPGHPDALDKEEDND